MIATAERWLPVVGWEGIYEVSDRGRIKSLARRIPQGRGCRSWRDVPEKIRELGQFHCDGYKTILLSSNGKRVLRGVHQLVMEAFVGPRLEGMIVCHNDGNPTNNHLSNLRYDTVSANALDRERHRAMRLAA